MRRPHVPCRARTSCGEGPCRATRGGHPVRVVWGALDRLCPAWRRGADSSKVRILRPVVAKKATSGCSRPPQTSATAGSTASSSPPGPRRQVQHVETTAVFAKSASLSFGSTSMRRAAGPWGRCDGMGGLPVTEPVSSPRLGGKSNVSAATGVGRCDEDRRSPRCRGSRDKRCHSRNVHDPRPNPIGLVESCCRTDCGLQNETSRCLRLGLHRHRDF